jgi:hypothetical protein
LILLTRLCAGQRATVLQLPAGAHPPEGVSRSEAAIVQRATFVG